MTAAIRIGLASALALATAAPAFAQYSQPYYQPTPQYRQDQRNYEADRSAYESRRADYDAARRDYERRRDDYERARADYDARYGSGAYVRTYGPAPVWDEAYWGPATPAADYYSPPPAAGYYGRDTAYTTGCRPNNNSAVTAGVIGALVGSALGSNVAARGRRTEGAVLGGAVGAGLGAAVGHANDKYKCDNRGPYYSYGDTIPYRESSYDQGRSGRYDYSYYSRMRCRLAPAAVDQNSQDYRYVRVCPDPDGRYRITG